jgi:hypothetical protein
MDNMRKFGWAGFTITVVLVILSSVGRFFQPSLFVLAQEQKRQTTTFEKAVPELQSPQLYAENLRIQITLVDLPGAQKPESSWEVTYHLYFISEMEFEHVVFDPLRREAAVGGGHRVSHAGDLEPNQFPEKILLAEGVVKKSRLTTLKERTEVVEHIPFKSRIPDRVQTKFAQLMISYATKISDAQLKTRLYRSSNFMATPFENDAAQPPNAVPRRTLYVNFLVTPQGTLFTSQIPRTATDTRW